MPFRRNAKARSNMRADKVPAAAMARAGEYVEPGFKPIVKAVGDFDGLVPGMIRRQSAIVSRFRSFILAAMIGKAGNLESGAENLSELLESRASASPDKTFVFSEADGRGFTYAEFNHSVDAAARMLVSHTIRKGDVVSLLMPNSAEYVIAYFACWKLGALAGPVNSLLKEHEIEFVVNNSEAKAVLVASEFRERIENIRGDLPRLRSVITFDDEAEACAGYARLRRAGSEETKSTPEACVPSDDAIIIYTSGTTGKPQGCFLTHGDVIAKAPPINDLLQFT